MTSFGGNFIQAPNPIDFDKVFLEFARLGETGNISVPVTVASGFLLYFVVLIFARRTDKRDKNKVCVAFKVIVFSPGKNIHPICMYLCRAQKFLNFVSLEGSLA